jgi:small conductance mechanosensitive channel
MHIKEAFDANDIMIPFPIRTLDFGIRGGEKLSEMDMRVMNDVQK